MARVTDGIIQFLDGGDNQSAVACHLVDEFFGVVGGVYAVGTEVVEFFAGLVVEVSAIDHKQHFMDFWECGEDLGCFEAGEGFAWACGVPDVAVFVGVFDALDNRFDGVILIRTQHHQHFVGLVQDDVFADHFGEVAFLQKGGGEVVELGD